ncbi:tetratricopeptide repeat protein [Niallia sp. XMNu-256]|uniref:tetratricopeptide repeat protein n=1 Tax=Niallia sp. XMNu-256 TaxID=3082444 RepID=UPI0030D464EF
MGKNAQAKTKGQLLSFIPTGEYYFTLGLKAFQRREFKKAIKYLKRAMHLEPGEPMIVCQLAIIYTEIGDFHQSNELLHLIIEELDEEMVECHYFLANNYAHMGYFKDAYSHLLIYLENDPDGEFIHEAEDLLEILTLEEDFLDDEHDELIMKQEQAKKMLESGHFPKAVKLLKTVIKDFPEYWSAYNNLALAYFYLGEIDKASNILDQVMEKNPGNLHAICNKLVFAYFQKDFSEVKELSTVLKKVKPLLADQQFKLGATFALVGDYDTAYGWFHKLYKHGYDGDGPFYYWFSYAAYFTGREQLSHSLWENVIRITPEKKDLAPWNKENEHEHVNGFEDFDAWILKNLNSDLMEERLFAIFLLSKSQHKESILSKNEVQHNNKLSKLENQYMSMVKMGKKIEEGELAVAHKTAQLLYKSYHPIGTVEAGLYLLWFSVFTETIHAQVVLKNEKALAGAIDYIWKKLRNEKCSQQKVAQQYGLSSSTLQKYVKILKEYLD